MMYVLSPLMIGGAISAREISALLNVYSCLCLNLICNAGIFAPILGFSINEPAYIIMSLHLVRILSNVVAYIITSRVDSYFYKFQ